MKSRVKLSCEFITQRTRETRRIVNHEPLQNRSVHFIFKTSNFLLFKFCPCLPPLSTSFPPQNALARAASSTVSLRALFCLHIDSAVPSIAYEDRSSSDNTGNSRACVLLQNESVGIQARGIPEEKRFCVGGLSVADLATKVDINSKSQVPSFDAIIGSAD